MSGLPHPEPDATHHLLNRISDQPEESWARLVQRCDSKLRVLLHFMLRDGRAPAVDADDVLQEVWTEAVAGVARFENRGAGSFYAWLTGILRNKVFHATREAAHPAVARAESRLDAERAGGPRGLLAAIEEVQTGVSSRVAKAEVEARVMRILDQLPAKLREVLLLRIYEARSGRETAAALGVHESTVSVRLKQALHRCSRLMGAG
jgi:RNA polymerase sigma-70 factor (ECF subfamily)